MRTLVFAFSLITLAGVARAQTPPSQPPLSVAQQPAGTAAESQGLRALDPNWVIVLLTIVLAWLANEDRRLNHRMMAHNVTVERAYVHMSHTPPGLFCIKDLATKGPTEIPIVAGEPIAVRVQITNHGHTPATILAAVAVMYVGEVLPEEPPYTDHKTWGAFFLMPNEGHFFVTRMIHTGLSAEQLSQVRDSKLFMWACGYVDYVDRFGHGHRSGYARRYSPSSYENNLVFETKPGYNYDVDRPLGPSASS